MNILICGVGGQGAVLASKILAQCAVTRGLPAHTAETIGMAQRGGSVTSHVRIGDAYSPLIPKGQADVILAFEPAEAARGIAFLKPDGFLAVSERGVMPAAGGEYDPSGVVRWLRLHVKNIVTVDADEVFRVAGTYRALNVALLGASCAATGFSRDEIETAMRALMSARAVAANLAALEYGCNIKLVNMKYELPVRKKLRLKNYDYSQAGYYFVTICVNGAHEILGDIVGANCVRPLLTETGKMVEDEIKSLHTIYENVYIDKYVIMPNHIHMIIVNASSDGRTQFAPTISRIIKQFKGSLTKKIGYSIWQKSYHDSIIRNENEYRKICSYIEQNPTTWQTDIYNNKRFKENPP